ncbi:hypothetical protein E4T39_00153 [Aureobasidium subglaciale]|nr:hypothetical protein E4T39_00153 [Aureobasidium subglaciale]
MDVRRNSGSYARPTGYLSQNDNQPTVHIPKTRRSEAAHVPHRLEPLPQLDTRGAMPHRNSTSEGTPISPDYRHRSKSGLVSDRSPLQKLEGKLDYISKEEKRARIEDAEYRARQKSVANQSRRVDGGGPQPLPYIPDAGYRRRERQHSSAPASGTEHDTNMQQRRSSVDYEGHLSTATYANTLEAEQKFRRASDALRMQGQTRTSDHAADQSDRPRRANSQDRPETTDSKSYRHRARDAGYVGAAAAAALSSPGDTLAHDGAGSQGRHHGSSNYYYQAHLPSRDRNHNSDRPMHHQGHSTSHSAHISVARESLLNTRLGVTGGPRLTDQSQGPDPIPLKSARTGNQRGPAYNIPPQTTGGQSARDQVGFSKVQPVGPPQTDHSTTRSHHIVSNLFHRHQQKDGVYRKQPELQEWRQANVARLTRNDHDLRGSVPGAANRTAHWWEGRASRHRDPAKNHPEAYDGAHDESTKTFDPPLYLKCGPLLRYTGMRQERVMQANRTSVSELEIWRGSIMIVTQDEHSSYEDIPTLRLFTQPMDLSPAPSTEHGHDLPPDYDPVAGQMKVSRTGQPLYVRPVSVLEDGVDISRVENGSGLFELASSSTNQGPRQTLNPTRPEAQHNTMNGGTRTRSRDGEKAGKFREVKAARLHRERGVTFWRFNLEIELGLKQARVAYRINQGPAIGFWVPGRGQSMNIMFHSCNGFSLSVNSHEFTGPDPLWRDVLNKHSSRPFHVMLGGGDQIYNDAAMRDTTYFKEWLQTKNPEHKHRADFSEEMQDELESFYLDRYSMWFSQGLFSMANSQIPMVNIWDDHDIIDGYGSYPHHFMSTRVFAGLGAVAFKYYMLFQHQSVVSETQRDEPSWILGASPGPYINELSRSVFMFLGRKVALLGLDCRTERMRDEVLSQQSYDIVFDRCRSEIVQGETKHLIVLLGVPIAYPRLNFLENILTSRVMDPIKALGRTGLLGGFINKFDGGVEILDDLDDHWTAKHHKPERNWFIQELQELAASKSVRITILGGDVHLGAVGQFYTKKKLGVHKDRDHRYMPNVISSAIVNTPPPNIMGDVLNKRNKIHHLDAETDEDMIPMFEYDVNGKARNNLHLLPRRNFCSIREYIPGSTPPSSPGPEYQAMNSRSDPSDEHLHPSDSLARSTSVSKRGFRPGNLVRRLSGSSARESQQIIHRGETHAMEAYGPDQTAGDDNRGSYSPQTQSRPINQFHRRPTDLSEKAAIKASAKGGPEGEQSGHINLESGLDICLHMEVDQKDPAGVTEPYRLLVPALWYEGAGDINTARFKSRGASMMDRIRGRSVTRSPNLDDRSLHSRDSRSSSESFDGQPTRRPDDIALNTMLQTTERESTANRTINYPHRQGEPSNVGGFNKETGPSPPRHRHPALAGASKEMPRETLARPPAGPHPSESLAESTQQKRSWNPFGRRRQQEPDRSDQRLYDDDDYTESEESFTESELDEDHYHHQQRGRRTSIADRVFGRNDAQRNQDLLNDKSQSIGQPEIAKKSGWKIWR